MENFDKIEKGRAYVRNLVAFHEIDTIMYGLFMMGVGAAIIFYPALFAIPNIVWYLLIGMVILREMLSKKRNASALATGTHPNQHPPEGEGQVFANSVFAVSRVLDRIRWIMIIAGIVMRDYGTSANMKLIGGVLLLVGIGLMGLIQLWYFVRVWMWECVVLAAAYFCIPIFAVTLSLATLPSVLLFCFTVGGLDIVGASAMFLRWRSWAKTVQGEPTELELET